MKKNYMKNFKRKPGIAIAVLIAIMICYILFYYIRKPPDQEETYEISEVEKTPECINLAMVRSSVKYPPKALESGQEGTVFVKVLVGTDGKVIRIGSISGPEVFHNEVIEKATELKFTIGLLKGKPVKVWVTVPFRFKLKE